MLIIGSRSMQLCNFAVMCKIQKAFLKISNFSTFKDVLNNSDKPQKNVCGEIYESKKFHNSEPKTHLDDESKDKLIKWAIQNNISYVAFSRLLEILRDSGVRDIPKNSKLLIKAREDAVKISSVPPGFYTHFGFKKNLITLIINLMKKNLLNTTDINVSIFIDQLLLVKLTQQSLWVILGSIVGFMNNIFFIGVYQGYSRPNNANLFLSEFVQEAKELCTEGLEINNITYSVTIKNLICDAPAKAFVLNVKDFNGYSSCTKCNTVGKYKNRKVCFLEKSSPKKDEDFEKDELYQNGKTKLLEIPNFGIVSNVTLDYMHLVCLGVVHKLLSIWLNNNNNNYWICEGSASNMIKDLSPVYPCEFTKKPVSFKILSRWEASNFRQFLLYYGPVVLKNNLKEDYYNHFLLLHVACRLLCISADRKNVDVGRTLLNSFVENYKKLYETEHITHNFHGLYHLADECASHGTLDSFSAFPFEKFLLKLRNSIKKIKKKSVPQTVLKVSYDNIFSKSLNRLVPHENKVLKKLNSESDKFQNCSDYQILSFNNFSIIPDTEADKYVLLKNGKIIEVTNVLKERKKSKNNYLIAGKEFSSICNFYSGPFEPLKLNMFKVRHLSNVVELWPDCMIDKKFMKIPVGDEESVMISLLDHNF